MPLFVVEVISSVERVVCRRDGSLFGSNKTQDARKISLKLAVFLAQPIPRNLPLFMIRAFDRRHSLPFRGDNKSFTVTCHVSD